MFLAIVKGNVVATTKNESLVGKKLLIVQKVDPDNKPFGECLIAIDTVGAGASDRVLVTSGGGSRDILSGKSAVDLAIVGIVDAIEFEA